MKSDYDFNFSVVGWFRNKSNEIRFTKNKIPYVWCRLKVSGSSQAILLNIFQDKISSKKIDNLSLGDLIKIAGYINYGNDNKYYLVPTKIELIAKNNEITKEKFQKLDTHTEKEETIKNQENNIDDEIVEMNWDKN